MGPLLFAERFAQVIGLEGKTSESALKFCDQICKYLARRASIYLTHNTATLAAVALTLALGVCADKTLSQKLSAPYLPELKKLNKHSDFWVWWSPETV